MSKREEMLETIDNQTNAVMDIIRDEFRINPDTNKDDILYSKIHNVLKQLKANDFEELQQNFGYEMARQMTKDAMEADNV